VTKRSSQDKAEGAIDKLTGRAKEAGGSLTGNKDKKAEGRAEQDKGTLKKKKGSVKDGAVSYAPPADPAPVLSSPFYYWPPCTFCRTSSALLKFSVPEFLICSTSSWGALLPSALAATSSLPAGKLTPCR
jgi:uncharacterized protein YjbJ (UPF0337 family)